MDSGNSDSFQSSNGGDEEYNSHGGGDTISAFINQSTTRTGGLMYNPLLHPSTNQSMFDPINSNYQNMQNNLLLNNNNLDFVWSKTPRSDPNCTESTNPLSSQQLCTIQNINLPSSSVTEMMNTTSSLQVSEKHGLASVNCQNNKKRSRASRRAPTTVLTTDTTNFRAMVQEFTGIPAPPFTSSSSLFPRNTKLDNIFGTPSSMRTNNLEYFSTPFSTKVVQPILSQTYSSTMLGVSMADSLRTNVDDSYKLLQSSNHFTMQNPILASLLQSNPPKLSISDNYQSIFESKTRHGSMQIQSSNRVLDEFGGLGQGLVDKNGSLGALPGLVSTDPARSFSNNNNGGCDDLSRNVANGKRLKGMIEDGATNEGIMEIWNCSSTE
ncbi:hypothetical protein LIER_37541 [Lithospermum erythrorhizon]|uniref:VQ domain-containing protein n=1 Tax=Lithospermum erythrorhizon TaxID=34254 RepID=A0AAV3PN89_LITER